MMIKEIPGYPKQFATTDGFIYSKRSGEYRQKPMRIHRGYYRVNLRNSSYPVKTCVEPVHKIILETFVGKRPPGYVCRHLNGNPLDNRLENICWGTPSENVQDSIRHGTAVCLRRGEDTIRAKLSNAEVAEIRDSFEKGISYTALSKKYKVSYTHIHDIITFKTRIHG